MYVQKRFKDAEAFDSAGITMQPFVKESSYISKRNLKTTNLNLPF
jgi:hypothetical protein